MVCKLALATLICISFLLCISQTSGKPMIKDLTPDPCESARIVRQVSGQSMQRRIYCLTHPSTFPCQCLANRCHHPACPEWTCANGSKVTKGSY